MLEAFRAGLPVVASDVEGPAELIEDGRTGLLFPPGDAQRLATQLETLAGDPALRERLGSAARAAFEASYDLEVSASGWRDYMKKRGPVGRPRLLM